MKNKYPLLIGIISSSILLFGLGYYSNSTFYKEKYMMSASSLPINYTMKAIHDGHISEEINRILRFDISVINDTFVKNDTDVINDTIVDSDEKVINEATVSLLPELLKDFTQIEDETTATTETVEPETIVPETYEFSTVSDEYFKDAVFIGDSRTVGIHHFSGIKNATFLCATSLTIYDYDKPKIEYNNISTSIRDVLKRQQFGKVYIMLGINECGYGSTEDYFKIYKNVIDDIRLLQPNSLIFVESNLLVTQKQSERSSSINNKRLSERNEAISELANQKDIFYININESSLCKDNALIDEYTWDNIHIKAQYYPIWKEFLLEHAIII